MHHDIQKIISYHNFYLFFPICMWKEFKLFQLLERFKKNVPMHHPSIKKSLYRPTVYRTGVNMLKGSIDKLENQYWMLLFFEYFKFGKKLLIKVMFSMNATKFDKFFTVDFEVM